MAKVDADRNRIFGLLALRIGWIDRSDLVAAFHVWTRDKARPMAEILIEQGAIDADQRVAVEALVALHLEKFGGDPEKSLESLVLGGSSQESRERVGDPAIEATLAYDGTGLTEHERVVNPNATDAVGTDPGERQRFRVLRPHARGGLGAVFVALDAELNREVALKQILDRHAADPASRARFLLEAEITGGLEHPGIVPVYSLGTDVDGRPYYAMRFIRGDNLKEVIVAFHADESLKCDPGRRSLALRKLLRRFLDVCNTIEYAHTRGVLHRDIKPGNVIVGEHGETLVVDWGLAKALRRVEPGAASGERTLVASSASGGAETLPGSALGTPAYMSPEQSVGDLERLGPRSDVYSLGATLYSLLTGKPPFEGDDAGAVLVAVQEGEFPPPRQLDPTIDPALEAVCLKAMALEPEHRYASPRALADDVERWMADEPVSARPESIGQRLSRWERRNRVLIRAGGAALMLVTLVSLAAFLMVSASRRREHGLFVEATRQKSLADERRREAEALNRDLRRKSTQILLDDGLALCQAGDVGQGLLQLARGLGIAPDDAVLERLIRTNLDGWSGRIFPLRLHLTHGNRVRATFSRDGTRIATASDDCTARVWDAATGRPLTRPLWHEDEVNWVSFSPDGRRIVTASNDKRARIWEVATGRLLHALAHDSLNMATFSPDGNWVATASADHTARVWDAGTGAPRTPPLRHSDEVYRIAFSPDGSRIATAGADHTAQIWDAATGVARTPPLRHGDEVRYVEFSPDGTRLATASSDATARVWNVADGTPDGPPLIHRAKVNGIVFSPDGIKLLTASDDGTAQLWRLGDHRPLIPPLTHQGAVLCASFSPDGLRIATAGQDGNARIWDAATGRPQGSAMRHRNWVYRAEFSPDGSRLLTPSRDFTVRVWDVRPEMPTLALADHGGVVYSAVFSRDGARIGTACEDGRARIWDASTGRLLVSLIHRDGKSVRSLAFSPKGDRVVTAFGYQAQLWDLASGMEFGPPMRHEGTVLFTSFSPDGARVSTAGMDGYARIWDAATGERRAALRHPGPVLEANFDPRGDRLVTASADRTARVWDAATGEPIGRPLEHSTEVWSAAFSPDGLKVVTAGQENAVRIWDLATGRPETRVVAHRSFVYASRFSPDGTKIVTASNDTTAQVWDVASGRPLGPPSQLRGEARSVNFSPDGTRLVVAGADRVVGVHILPRPLPGDLRRITAWIESQTGLGGDERATMVLDGPGWDAARRRLAELGGSPK